MGRIFLEHFGGSYLFVCATCNAFLTNRSQLMSVDFDGPSGNAYLFDNVANLIYGHIQDRNMTTGRHFIRDVFCKRCGRKLGWAYEYAFERNQTYKEGHIILEKAYLALIHGILEIPTSSTY